MTKLDTSYITPTCVDDRGTFHVVYDRGRKERYDTPRPRSIWPYPVGEPKGIEWLWANRIPRGKLTLIEGPAGAGKSYLAADLAARVSSGVPWGDGPAGPQLAGEVLYVCSERETEDTVSPRVIRGGADWYRFVFLSTAEVFDPYTGPQGARTLEFPQDLNMLEYFLKNCPCIRLVVIDPIRDYCATPRLLRATLGRLDELAAKYNVAVVATIQADVKFTRDGQMRKTCRPWDEAARCVWCVNRDADDPELHRFEPKRTTFCREPVGAAFRVNSSGAVVWEELPLRVPALEKCMSWLEELLSQGAVWAAEGLRDAAEFGFPATLVYRAREKLGIKSDRNGGIARKGKWWWTRDGRPPEPQVVDDRPATRSRTDRQPARNAAAQGASLKNGGLNPALPDEIQPGTRVHEMFRRMRQLTQPLNAYLKREPQESTNGEPENGDAQAGRPDHGYEGNGHASNGPAENSPAENGEPPKNPNSQKS